MRITRLEILHVRPIGTLPGENQRPILVRIDTDEGVYGLGEAGLAYGAAGQAAVGILRDFGARIIGLDPLNIESVWNRLQRGTFWGQGGGAVIASGLSAIDVALWDIKGKVLGVPVYNLLGGKTRGEIRAYASQIHLDWGPKRVPAVALADYSRNAAKAVEAGFDALKVDVFMFDESGRQGRRFDGPLRAADLRLGRDRIKAVREAVGPDVDIIVENHAVTDVTSSAQFAKAIEEFGIFYYEEITTPLYPRLHRLAKDSISIPVASGERIFTRWGFLPFILDRSLDVIQPDLGNSGGLTEVKKIADLAHVFEITAQVHVAGTNVIAAAALHLEAVIPNFLIHEHHQKLLMPAYRELTVHDYQPVGGYLAVPELPGIGQELTKAAYERSDRYVVE